jgi:hypothetical protein
MTGPDPAWDPWTDQSYLRESQYRRTSTRPPGRIGMAQGELLLRSQFASVTRHDFEAQLRVADAEPIAAYVRSRVPDAGPLAEAVLARLPADPARFPITTHSGCLVCA